MSSQPSFEGIFPRRNVFGQRLGQALATILFIVSASAVNAAPLPPPPDYLADAGDSYFSHGDAVTAIELLDLLAPDLTFGFHFQDDPATRYTIFDNTDVAPPQQAQINFIIDRVVDLDAMVLEASFVETSPNIGLFVSLGANTLYSDPLLNGGLDVFSAFQNIGNPLTWLLVFEAPFDQSLIAINANIVSSLSPATVIPLPPSVYLMGSLLPLLMLISRHRKRSQAVVSSSS